MSRWKVLPESLDAGVRRLVVEMRRLKDHSGLSLAALAGRTAYSRSSWERYLNGKAVPPREAVEALAEACGGDPVALTALWEVAARSVAPPLPASSRRDDTSDRETEAEVAAEVEAEPGRGRRGLGRVLLLAALAVAVLGATVGLLVERPWEPPESDRAQSTAAVVPTAGHSVLAYPCHYEVRDDRQYAGHSTTLTEQYGVGASVEAVAEIQCLVKKHGFDPNGIDGSFGPNTKSAVQEFQRARGLDDDGVVGPKTWRELRAADE